MLFPPTASLCDAHAIVIREKCDQVRGPVSASFSNFLDEASAKRRSSLRGWNRELLTRGPQDSGTFFQRS